MSLRPLTSCDFVTRLPVCPSNGLPLFKDFPADEVARLERYVQTPDYAALRDLAPALRAYHVAKFLGDETDHERLWLLIDAALYDAPASRSDPANLDLLLAEATATGDKLHADQRAHVFAIIAYQLALAGLDDEARSWMSDAVRVSDDDEFFASYRRALEQCIGQMSSEACAPDTPFSP